VGADDDAELLYREALALAESCGLLPLVAHCHLGLGELYGAARSARAALNVATATMIYCEM